MSTISSIIQHELKLVFFNRKAWYCVALLQAILGIIFNWLLTNFLKTQAITKTMHYGITEEVLHPLYASFALIMLSLLPMIVTQSVCAEKQRGTVINYYCAPINFAHVILGKFITLNILLIISIVSLSILPISTIGLNILDWGHLSAIIAGAYLVLTCATAICFGVAVFMSNIARANLIIFFAIFICIGIEWAAHYMGSYSLFLQMFGLLFPLKTFLAGIISIRAIAVYLLLTTVFLWLGCWRFNNGWQHV